VFFDQEDEPQLDDLEAGFLGDEDYDDAPAADYYSMIPIEIKPTRSPGIDE
jgi:hypothetical protein